MSQNYKSIFFALGIIFLITTTSKCGSTTSNMNYGTQSTASKASSNIDQYLNSAINKLDNRDYEGAIDAANKSLSVDSSFGDPYLIRGIARLHKGLQNEGIEDIKSALSIYKNKGRLDRVKLAEKTLEEMQASSSSLPSPVSTCPYNIDSIISKLQNNSDDVNFYSAKQIYDDNQGCQRKDFCGIIKSIWLQKEFAQYRASSNIITATSVQCMSNFNRSPSDDCEGRARESQRELEKNHSETVKDINRYCQ